MMDDQHYPHKLVILLVAAVFFTSQNVHKNVHKKNLLVVFMGGKQVKDHAIDTLLVTSRG